MSLRAIATTLAVLAAAFTVYAQAPEAPPPPAPPALPETALQTGAPEQVNITVKVVEFQATKGVETGLSVFYARRNDPKPFGRVSDGNGAITTADLTFPLDTEGAITVFLDRIRLADGDIEAILQGLVNENQAFILSRPSAEVLVRNATPTIIETVEENPYENPTVVGNTIVNTTGFKKTGVILTATVPDIIDDDQNWLTTEDTYIRLYLTATVKELGEDIVVAVDNRLAGSDQVRAPTFVSRSITTQVWVRHGQVLVMGGLFRNRSIKSLDTVPGLTTVEDAAVGLVERVIPGNFIGSPLSSTIGNRQTEAQRRELVFFIKAEAWEKPDIVKELVPEESVPEEDLQERKGPTDIIGGVIGGITNIPESIAEGMAGEQKSDGIEKELGRESK